MGDGVQGCGTFWRRTSRRCNRSPHRFPHPLPNLPDDYRTLQQAVSHTMPSTIPTPAPTANATAIAATAAATTIATAAAAATATSVVAAATAPSPIATTAATATATAAAAATTMASTTPYLAILLPPTALECPLAPLLPSPPPRPPPPALPLAASGRLGGGLPSPWHGCRLALVSLQRSIQLLHQHLKGTCLRQRRSQLHPHPIWVHPQQLLQRVTLRLPQSRLHQHRSRYRIRRHWCGCTLPQPRHPPNGAHRVSRGNRGTPRRFLSRSCCR